MLYKNYLNGRRKARGGVEVLCKKKKSKIKITDTYRYYVHIAYSSEVLVKILWLKGEEKLYISVL